MDVGSPILLQPLQRLAGRLLLGLFLALAFSPAQYFAADDDLRHEALFVIRTSLRGILRGRECFLDRNGYYGIDSVTEAAPFS